MKHICWLLMMVGGIYGMENKKQLRLSPALQFESFDAEKQEFKISKAMLESFFSANNQKLEEILIPHLAPKVKASKLTESQEIDLESQELFDEINKMVIKSIEDAFERKQQEVDLLETDVQGKWSRNKVILVSSISSAVSAVVTGIVALIINFTAK